MRVPAGFGWFPNEFIASTKHWMSKKYSNLVHFTYMKAGGHFNAYQCPDLFAADVRLFARRVKVILVISALLSIMCPQIRPVVIASEAVDRRSNPAWSIPKNSENLVITAFCLVLSIKDIAAKFACLGFQKYF